MEGMLEINEVSLMRHHLKGSMNSYNILWLSSVLSSLELTQSNILVVISVVSKERLEIRIGGRT